MFNRFDYWKIEFLWSINVGKEKVVILFLDVFSIKRH